MNIVLLLLFILISFPATSFAWLQDWTCTQDCNPLSPIERADCQAFKTATGALFTLHTGNVSEMCEIDAGGSSTRSNEITSAIDRLVNNCYFTREDFQGVDFFWCTPLQVELFGRQAGALGMVPRPNQILLARSLRTDPTMGVDGLAGIIGHEMIHIRQIRQLGGYGNFACQYSREMQTEADARRVPWDCASLNEQTGNDLECEAYRFEDFISFTPDFDGDGSKDSCDRDDDNDSIEDFMDKCPNLDNTGYNQDHEGDGIGDLCDDDDDNDGVNDRLDNCPLDFNSDQNNMDADPIGDACDDSDGDRVIDRNDNCPFNANPFQEDIDNDGEGNVCDSDADGDTVSNDSDNCPLKANLDQQDSDGDLIGNACDNCLNAANANQADSDCDGIGDACDGHLGRCPTGLPGEPHLQKPDLRPKLIRFWEALKAFFRPGGKVKTLDQNVTAPSR